MPPASEGGVFIPTEEIYRLLRESIERTDERLTEIRSDIRAMNERTEETKVEVRDHESRIRTLEEKLNKLPWTNLAAILGAVSGLVLGYQKITGK